MPMSPEPPWVAPLDAAIGAQSHDPTSRYAQLATVRPDGKPANRTVVIRGRIGPRASLLVTTDARSAKADELRASPWAELCWYFTTSREQFRIFGGVRLIGPDGGDGSDLGEARARVWEGLPVASKRSFAGPAPGTERGEEPADASTAPESPSDHFLLLVIDPESVDALDLKTEPHRRVLYRREGSEGWSSKWINP